MRVHADFARCPGRRVWDWLSRHKDWKPAERAELAWLYRTLAPVYHRLTGGQSLPPAVAMHVYDSRRRAYQPGLEWDVKGHGFTLMVFRSAAGDGLSWGLPGTGWAEMDDQEGQMPWDALDEMPYLGAVELDRTFDAASVVWLC